MSTDRQPTAVAIWEGESWVAFARLVNLAGDYVTQASLSSIACNVYDETTRAKTLIASPTVTISSAVYDTLQTSDDRWTEDSTGYNFAFTLDGGTCFPLGGRQYRVEFVFTASSKKSALVFTVKTTELLSVSAS